MDDFLQEFRGAQKYKRFDEMRRNSAEIGALLASLEFAIRGTVEWGWESELGEDDPRLEFLERALNNCSHSWNDHISEVLTMPVFGFAPFAVWYERVESEILWRKYLMMGQDTVHHWEFDEEGGIMGMWQTAYPRYTPKFIPIERMILYRTRVERNNPEGRSLLRNAWIDYYHAKIETQIEGIGMERDLAGMPVITLPLGATTDENDSTSDASKANKLVRNVRNDEQAGVVKPSGWGFELLASGGGKSFDTDKIINRHHQRMLMSVLSQFLLLGQEGVGSLALSADQTDFYTMLVNGVTDIIAETFTKFAVPPILKLNGYDPNGIKRTHTPAGDVNLEALTNSLQRVSDKLTWRTADEVWLRQTMKLPEAEPEELDAEKQKNQEQAMAEARAKAAANPLANSQLHAEFKTALTQFEAAMKE